MAMRPIAGTMVQRAQAARRAIRHGADPALMLDFVISPTAEVAEAIAGVLPRGWRWLTDEEHHERERAKERHRMKWKKEDAA
jgi:hypothetical protein